MRWYYKLPLRLRSLFRNQQTAQELNDEIQFHLQHQIDEYVAQGMDPKEARRAALRLLGGLEQIKEECREMRNVSFIETFVQDIGFGFRVLRRSPGFSALADHLPDFGDRGQCRSLQLDRGTAAASISGSSPARPVARLSRTRSRQA